MNQAPKLELEPQTKIAQKDLEKVHQLYLKPSKSIPDKAKFKEDFRKEWEFAKEYVNFIAEHKECIGDTIEMLTKPYPGVPAEYWEIPSNKPLWAPRYVAEQLKRRFYHRMRTEDRAIGNDRNGQYYGQMVVDMTIPRLDAHPISSRKSIFMGASNFS